MHKGIMKGSLHMKKIFGVSVLSAMLILGQPLMALADATGAETTSSDITSQDAITPRIINFADIEEIIEKQNIDVQIDANNSLIDKLGYADLTRTLKEYEDDLEDVNQERDNLRASGDPTAYSQIIMLGAEKRGLLDAIERLERAIEDRPTDEASDDLTASRMTDTNTRLAEGMFIAYNQLKLALSDISLGIETKQDELVVKQLQESLGIVTHSYTNGIQTELVAMQTSLESLKFQRASVERKLRDLLNDPENAFIIGESLAAKEDPTTEDEDATDVVEDTAGAEDEGVVEGDADAVDPEEDSEALDDDEEIVDSDLEQAQKNSYALKAQELQIVSLQTALERAKKDNGMSSLEYKTLNYQLTNANLKLAQLKDHLNTEYYGMIDDVLKKQNDLRLAEQILENEKVTLAEAQAMMRLGMISRLAMEGATTKYQVQENAVKTKQIELFIAEDNYEWFLKGMSPLG